MQEHLLNIVQCSIGGTPENMLETTLNTCIEIAGASGGSILAEEGPNLKFMFSNVQELIGLPVPFNSVAGETANKSLVIYTFAPLDKRHYADVDEKINMRTKYLLSIPIPSIHTQADSATKPRNAGVLQLLFEENIFPELDVEAGPQEFPVNEFRERDALSDKLKNIFIILPIIAFGMEIVNLRKTSYQAIHELKNKMISGLSWINYLKDDITQMAPDAMNDESVQEDFELASSSISEGAELAKTYLQFTKIFSPVMEEADINDVLKETAASVKALAAELGAENFITNTDFSSDLSPLMIDQGQLKMAFFNLCKNGVEALVQLKTEHPCISIISQKQDDRVRITISDNGPGMPKEIAENLFIPFKTKKEGGTGLGLTITKKIIDTHGGTINCTTGDAGTTFEVII